MTTATVLPAVMVELNRDRRQTDWLVRVTDPAIENVSVRWNSRRPGEFRCSICGLQDEARCAHAFSAALLLAEQLLGLHRVAELHPITTDLSASPTPKGIIR